ncbi:MAG: FAD-dependent oxidoreductase, partial [Aurantimonas coralicida]
MAPACGSPQASAAPPIFPLPSAGSPRRVEEDRDNGRPGRLFARRLPHKRGLTMRVAVIGAGVAGLVTALELAERGADVAL